MACLITLKAIWLGKFNKLCGGVFPPHFLFIILFTAKIYGAKPTYNR